MIKISTNPKFHKNDRPIAIATPIEIIVNIKIIVNIIYSLLYLIF